MIRRVLRRAVRNTPTDGEREYEIDSGEFDVGRENSDTTDE